MNRVLSMSTALCVAFLFYIFTGSAGAATVEIPAPLAPWEDWVRHGMAEHGCPAHFDDADARRCWWPSRLTVDAGDQGGLFEMQATVFAPSWVELPGAAGQWPESVIVDGAAVPVTARAERPACWLEPGDYRLQGAFVWETMPEWIQIPPAAGLISLTVDGREIKLPERATDGRLRLHGERRPIGREDTMAATVFRLLEDDIPMRVVTRILVQVSGRARDIRLPDLLPPGSTIMAIDSPLPSRLANAGELIVQAKPGTWDIRVTVRLGGPVDALGVGPGAYGDEIWSFKAYNHLRMVKVTGAPPIEPSRTRMPDEWKGFPAYLMQPQTTLAFETIRRGDPDPAPDQLNLARTWWLDFDGSGFSIHDRIEGTLSRTWHLALAAPTDLGRVAVDGQDQLITRQGEDALPGVQLRHGRLTLNADSRLPRTTATIPAVGWDHDFQQASGVLNLPPGWSLFSVAGVDAPPGTWLERWSLLDFFLVLIIAIATGKVRRWHTGLLALLTLVITFHEPGAPRHVWLHLLAVAALLKYLPDGWFRKLVWAWGAGALIVLLTIALPFTVQQVRYAIYPQLDRGAGGFDSRRSTLPLQMSLEADTAAVTAPAMKSAPRPTLDRPEKSTMSTGRRVDFMPDAGVLVQTGPGLPGWHWRSVPLRWNGPVDRHQQIRLWLIAPLWNRALGLARAMLLLLFILTFLQLRHWRRLLPATLPPAAASTILLILLSLPGSAARADTETGMAAFPPQSLLDELRQRLSEPPPCLPRCADVSRLELAATPDQVRLILTLHAPIDAAIPLPVTQGIWQPSRILIDNDPVQSMARDDRGNLWMVLPQGVHEVKLIGATDGTDEIPISFPLPPHAGSYAGVGWQAQGFHPDGSMESTIALTRVQPEAAPPANGPKAEIPPFFHVTRTITLGLQWQATTRVQRLTAPGAPVVLAVPLLKDASLITPGITASDGMARIAMAPEENEVIWSTTLPITPTIALSAPADAPWTETWILDAGVMWRCTTTGLTAVHHQDSGSNWQPRWRPWPGEQVTIAVTRPEAVAGRSITVDSCRLTLTPGQRFSQSALNLSIRTSKGTQQQIELPPQANLQAVTVNNRSLPVRQDGRLVNIPLEPGAQQVDLKWTQLQGIGTLIRGPRVNVGDAAINATVTVQMPDQRWILLAGGPRLGPAVLFWSYLFVVLAAAVALGRTAITPLGSVQWLLLGLGLTQVPAPIAVLVAGWLLALGLRCRRPAPTHTAIFNLTQTLLVLLTLAALAGLYAAIERGLLGIPDMQIAGNESTRFHLNWTQDRIDGQMPVPWVLSLPQWIYHLLMLLWSLWLAFSLLSWLRWGWGGFSTPRCWQPIRWRRRKAAAAETSADARPNDPGGE